MIRTKPCGRGGCDHLVQETHGPKLFAQRRFCSQRCSALHRLATTGPWYEPTREQRSRGGRIGGQKSAASRHRVARQRAVTVIDAVMPAKLRARFEPEQLALVKVLLARMYDHAHRNGRSAGRSTRSRTTTEAAEGRSDA